MAAEAKVQKRKSLLRNTIIVVVLAAVVVGSVFLVSHHAKPTAASTTTSSAPVTSTTAAGAATTTTPTTAPVTTTTVAAANAAAQTAANSVAVAAGCPASTSATANNLVNHWKSAPPLTIDKTKTYTATVKTTAGTFVMTLDPATAPQTVNNFVFLAQQGFYHCVIFHRVIPGFMDQTGDPTGTGTGGPGYTIADENPPKASNAAVQYPVGSVAMANTGQPHTGGSQFFIVSGSQGESLPNSYALFGMVTSGLNVVQQINQQGSAAGIPPDVTQRILSVTITES
jgi:cyclophilin family peptidyl-prolyl cis-trans isomerase